VTDTHQYSLVSGYNSANHEPVTNIKPKIEKTRTLQFQDTWYKRFPWIHYSPIISGVVCFTCCKASSLGLLKLETKAEPAFITSGFFNWKKAIDKFTDHQKSMCHRQAVFLLQQTASAPPVIAQLSVACMKQQEMARQCLLKVVRSVKFLLRQGLAFRGHINSEGNLQQLLDMQAQDDTNLSAWLKRTTNFLSHQCIEEIQNIFSHTILRDIVDNVKQARIFAIVADGTQDITSKEQLSLCIRYVDGQLDVHEEFVGFHAHDDETTGRAIAAAILDILQRLSLNADQIRAQTYDGAANMDGVYNGCPAVIREQYPLVLPFRCGGHTTHLVAQHAVECEPLIHDSLQWVQELGKLYRRSTKFHRVFDSIVADCQNGDEVEDDAQVHCSSRIRPLCPTRWLSRHPAVLSVVEQYEIILNSLSEMSESGPGETATKARALHDKFNKGSTLLGLHMAMCITGPLHELNRVLQARKGTVSGMIECVQLVNKGLRDKRNNDSFQVILQNVQCKIRELDLDELQLPRPRKPPARLSGPGEAYIPPSVEEHYRKSYFTVLDRAITGIEDRWQTIPGSGLDIFIKMEQMIVTGKVDAVLTDYSDVNVNSLSIQLPLFVQHCQPTSLHSAQLSLQRMAPDMRQLFEEVEKVVRLLLVCPSTSCEAERSFSGLRRLKTWLRSSMSQIRLNSAAICHVHKHRLDEVSVATVAAEFAGMSETRRAAFGKF
jgi:hypothetical protein